MRFRIVGRRFSGECLEIRRVLADVGFARHDVDVSEFVSTNSLSSGDLDGDSDVDLLIASKDGRISWLPNLDGQGGFGPPDVIHSGSSFGDNLSASDLDGDGDLDVIASFPNAFGWFENVGGGRFGGLRIIAETNNSIFGQRLTVSDIDGDGDLDLFAVTRENDTFNIHWFENRDGRADFSPAKSVARGVIDVDHGDFDGDGDIDLVISRRDRLEREWLENTGSADTEWPAHRLPDSVFGLVRMLDYDDDGDSDLIGSYGNQIVWYENIDSRGEFASRRLIAVDVSLEHFDFLIDFRLDDIDADGTPDITPLRRGFHAPNHARPILRQQDTANRLSRVDYLELEMADVDGDNDLDTIYTIGRYFDEGLYVRRFESGQYSEPTLVADSKTFNSVEVTDIDGDGDLDIFATSFHLIHRYDHYVSDARFTWHENNGSGEFTEFHLIGEFRHLTGPWGQSRLIDLDDDGDLDILFREITNGVTFGWYSNDGGAFKYEGRLDTTIDQLLSLGVDFDGEVVPGFHEFTTDSNDVDGDGDLDIVAILPGGEVIWNEYRDDFERHVITHAPQATSLKTLDFDRDGFTDLLLAHGEVIDWLEFDTGTREFELRLTLPISARQFQLADFDLDGDWDIAVLRQDRVDWYEHLDEQGIFAPPRSIRIPRNGGQFRVGDMDGDGDPDLIVVTSNNLVWYENRPLADVNADRIFSSKDLVAIFQAGEYEDGIPSNSTFDEGDWNGDGEFDSADLILALQFGDYVS